MMETESDHSIQLIEKPSLSYKKYAQYKSFNWIVSVCDWYWLCPLAKYVS